LTFEAGDLTFRTKAKDLSFKAKDTKIVFKDLDKFPGLRVGHPLIWSPIPVQTGLNVEYVGREQCAATKPYQQL